MYTPTVGYDEILSIHSKFKDIKYEHWVSYELFTVQWWTMIILMIVSWIIWWKLLDRSRTSNLTLHGLFVFFSCTAMDAFGISHHLWIYPINVTAKIPHLVAVNWSMLPVIYMLIYQYYPRWISFVKASIAMSAVLSFIGEPFTQWFGIYYVFHWEHIWSFPIYVLIAIIGRWLVETLLSLKPRKQKNL